MSSDPQTIETKVEIIPDKEARAVSLRFTQSDKQAMFTLSKADTHWLIENLQKAVNSIGNRVKVK